jgi:uncharacterized membrane protein YeaQ/YmgE (transglycosylase-associated protein family)
MTLPDAVTNRRWKGTHVLAMDIGFGDILVYIVAGLIIGALARLIVPGHQDMGVLSTIIVGVIAAVIGGVLWAAIFPKNDGIAWIGSIIVGVVLVWIYAGATSRRSLT